MDKNPDALVIDSKTGRVMYRWQIERRDYRGRLTAEEAKKRRDEDRIRLNSDASLRQIHLSRARRALHERELDEIAVRIVNKLGGGRRNVPRR